MNRVLSIPALALLALGCAREAPSPRTPPPAGPPPPGYSWPPRVLAQHGDPAAHVVLASAPVAAASPAPAPTPPSPGTPEPPPVPALSPTAIASGDACLRQLAELGIRHRTLESRRGVETPIVVQGPLGGIEYVAGAGLPFECDCRLAVALHSVGPVLAELGVSKLRFSGAYVYRMSRVGRLSLHAYGLAIDVHEAFAKGRWQTVVRDYRAGLADGCATEAPDLNRVACQLRKTGLFKELLTPDHNADHRDHLHLAIAPAAPPAGGSPTRQITAER